MSKVIRFDVNRACPLSGKKDGRVIGHVKASAVWRNNPTYRDNCAEILEIHSDSAFPIVEGGVEGFSYAGWLPPPEFLTKVYEEAIDHSKTTTESHGYRRGLVQLAAAVLRIVERESQPKNKRLRLLDSGCGYGPLLRILGSREIEVFGFEPSPERAEVARQFASDVFHENEQLESVPPFDLLICTEVLEHLPEPREALARLKACAAPGAIFGLTVPDCDSAWMFRAFERHAKGGPLPMVINPWEHLNYFSSASLATLLTEYGIEVIHDHGQTDKLTEAARITGDVRSWRARLKDGPRILRCLARRARSTQLICRFTN